MKLLQSKGLKCNNVTFLQMFSFGVYVARRSENKPRVRFFKIYGR